MTNLYQVSALKQYTSESNYVNTSVLTESMMQWIQQIFLYLRKAQEKYRCPI